MNRKFIGTIILSIVLSTTALAGDRVVRMGTEGYYPPFNFFDSSGSVKGFDIDVAKTLCKKINAKCTFARIKLSNMIPSLKERVFI